ncbi:hypothetical protein Dpoa569_0003840 [Dickeya poaceiphila]|uniref:Uncharacterized protein n=1 Tax=Dickeya poaceiphila TaxID=568768 RepID=A0A5B8IKH2_9GAMM|nr:hypothetical protein Dpoa569_0003840 [Dickeya poaceiphila]
MACNQAQSVCNYFANKQILFLSAVADTRFAARFSSRKGDVTGEIAKTLAQNGSTRHKTRGMFSVRFMPSLPVLRLSYHRWHG